MLLYTRVKSKSEYLPANMSAAPGSSEVGLLRRICLTLLLCASFSGAAIANDAKQQIDGSDDPNSDWSILVFAGKNVRGFQSYPFKSTPGDQTLAGASVAWTPIDLPYGIVAGLDGGITIRDDGDEFDRPGTSAEFWAGPTLRHTGIKLGPILAKPAITVGLSAVTGSNGLERERELEFDGNAALLYYISPEIGFSLKSIPNVDLVYRLQHRSGARHVSYLPTIGRMGDTNNANSFGIRYHF